MIKTNECFWWIVECLGTTISTINRIIFRLLICFSSKANEYWACAIATAETTTSSFLHWIFSNSIALCFTRAPFKVHIIVKWTDCVNTISRVRKRESGSCLSLFGLLLEIHPYMHPFRFYSTKQITIFVFAVEDDWMPTVSEYTH